MTDKKKPGFRKWIILTLVLFGPGILLVLLSKGKQQIQPLPVMAPMNEFMLETQDGEILTLESLKGKITVVSTIQPTCPDTCGLHLNQASELIYEAIYNNREKHKDVQVISIATDTKGNPVKDFERINFALNKYVRNYDNNIWKVCTGNPEDFYDVEINGNVLYDQLSETSLGGKLYLNSLVLIDKEGNIRSVRLANGEAQVRDFSGEMRGLIGEYRHAKK